MPTQPVLLALNLSRARITLLGFTLAVNLFALRTLVGEPGSGAADRFALDLSIFLALFISFVVAAVATLLFLLSQRLDPTGNSNVRVFAVAEMLMFVAVAQTISGVSQEFLALIAKTTGTLNSQAAGNDVAVAAALHAAVRAQAMVHWLTALIWCFVVYVAPLWSLSRFPDSTRAKSACLAFYMLVTGAVFVASAHAAQVLSLSRGEDASLWPLFFGQFVAPLIWDDVTALAG